jgi:hypothetical protein
MVDSREGVLNALVIERVARFSNRSTFVRVIEHVTADDDKSGCTLAKYPKADIEVRPAT